MRLHRQGLQADPDQPIEVNHFRMFVPVSGYCWLDEATPSRLLGEENKRLLKYAPYMVVKASVDGASKSLQFPAQSYLPLIETPDLFRQFRDLKLDRDSLLRFANRYGWIGETGGLDYQNRGAIRAVGIHSWASEVQAMIVADQLLTWLQDDDRRALKDYFSWHQTEFNVRMAIQICGRKMRDDRRWGPRHCGETYTSWDRWLVEPNQASRLQEIGWKRGDLAGPARLAVINIVNSRLEALCHPRLYLDSRGGLTGHWTPANLLGCIWLQFYLTVTGQLELRRCTLCGNEMDVSQSRSTRKMHDKCSKTARMSRWRAKKGLQTTVHP